MSKVAAKNVGETEFLQAVEEVAEVIIPFIEENPKYNNKMLLERMVEPERVLMFRVPWLDDKGNTQTNRGYRIGFNSAIGPYKGGLRFHPSVNLSILNKSNEVLLIIFSLSFLSFFGFFARLIASFS